MNPDKELVKEIRAAFASMQTYQDFLNLLNKAKPHVYGKSAKRFTSNQLRKYASATRNPDRYVSFPVRKKSGGERVIHAPVKGLRAIQRTLAFILQCVFDPHSAAMGFARGRSIVDNARKHEGQRFVYNIDLKDFFPSVDQARVWKCLQLSPFDLHDSQLHLENHVTWDKFKAILAQNNHEIDSIPDFLMKLKGFEHIKPFPAESLNFIKGSKGYWIETTLGKVFMEENLDTRLPVFVLTGPKTLNTIINEGKRSKFNLVNKVPQYSRKNLAGLIAGLSCTSMEVSRKLGNQEFERVVRNVLPQGAPTSPVLTNVVCQRLDFLLTGLAKRFGLKYTRYADDITFSSMHHVYKAGGEFVTELQRIIKDQGFEINEDKTRIQQNYERQEVTGLVVNDRVNVKSRYIKQIRNWLYLWERYGYEKAYELFLWDYISDKGHVKRGKPDMGNVIGGKLDFLQMVKGPDNMALHHLRRRLEKVLKTKQPYKPIQYIKQSEPIQLVVMEDTAPYGTKQPKPDAHLKEVLDTFIKQGLTAAMKIYKPYRK